jgi:hypothetical protein
MPKPPRKVYTFKTLKSERGWPYSRQAHAPPDQGRTIPATEKGPGGALNIWTEDQIDDYYASALTSGAY